MLKWKRFGWTVKDEKARQTYKLVEVRKLVLKSMLSSVLYKSKYKMYFVKKIHSFSKMTSLGRYRRYCLFTYSGRVVFKKFKLGRHMAKSMASLGYLSGLRKSSF